MEPSQEHQDTADMQAAVEALNGLRSGVSSAALSRVSTCHEFDEDYTPMTSLSDLDHFKLSQEATEQERFLERVSQMPWVSNALRAYEISRNSSRVVKIGTDLMEHSLQATLSKVVSRQHVEQLDEFACRQLDRFTPPAPPTQDDLHSAVGPSPDDRALTARPASPSRSRWQSVLVEAGGLGAAVSDDSMRSLKFCLVLLGSATHSLQAQIHLLRQFIESLRVKRGSMDAHLALPPPPKNEAEAARQQEEMLSSFKSEILATIKKAVDIISTYAGAALPEPAKKVVKEAILSLPSNWARTVQAKNEQQLVAARPADKLSLMQEASERVLTFAVEGLDVINGVARIFGDTVERADAWLQRLQTLGLSRQSDDDKTIEYTAEEDPVHEQMGMQVDAK